MGEGKGNLGMSESTGGFGRGGEEMCMGKLGVTKSEASEGDFLFSFSAMRRTPKSESGFDAMEAIGLQ